jgi:glycoside/pentoside/hexuronide:cation symporter, GPH family
MDPHVDAPRLTFATKVCYGTGQAAEGLKNGAFGIFLLFYYNHVLGLSGTLAGLALGIALVFDAITDPLVGSMSDNWRSRLGRRHPFMYAAIVPLALSFYFLLAPPALGEIGLFAWLLIFAVLARGAMTLYYVPHQALGAELSTDFVERTRIVGYRQFFGTFGGLLAVVIGFGAFFASSPEFPQGQFNVAAYAPYALTLSVLMSIAIFLSAWGTRSRIPWLPKPRGTAQRISAVGALTRMVREAVEALGNRSFRWMFFGILVVFLMVGVDGALNLYMNTFFWDLRSSDLLYFYIASPIGVMVGATFAGKLTTWFDKKPSVVWGTAWWSACQIVPVVLRMLDWFPQNGTTALVETLVAIKFVQGVGVVQSLVTFGSMVADIADEHELLHGKRQEGIFFAAASFANKCTTGFGNIVAGVALDLIAWPRGAHIQSAADVPHETIIQLGLIYGPVVAGFAVVCVWCFSHYTLTRQRHQAIVAALVARGRDDASTQEAAA